MPYDPSTGLWKAENDSVAKNVTGLLSDGNPYIEQAKSQGVDYANSRGLQNSSIAAGASEKAAYDAAVPIATADANITAQKNLSSQGYAQSTGLQGQQIASSEKIANLSAATQTNIAAMNIDAAAKQQAQQILSNEKLGQLSSDTQQQIAAMNISDADKQQLLQLASQERTAAMTQDTQLQVANMNVSANQQDKAQGAAVSYANIYSSMVNTINANKDIPADARATALANAKTLYDNGLNLVQQTYNVQLDWGQNTAPPAAAPLSIPAEGMPRFQDNTVQ